MIEANFFRSDKAPLTNWVGHQVTKVCSAWLTTLDKVNDPNINWSHKYSLHLLQQQKYDFLRGNAASTLALMVVAIASNSAK